MFQSGEQEWIDMREHPNYYDNAIKDTDSRTSKKNTSWASTLGISALVDLLTNSNNQNTIQAPKYRSLYL